MNTKRVPVLIKLYRVQRFRMPPVYSTDIFRQYFHGTLSLSRGSTNCSLDRVQCC